MLKTRLLHPQILEALGEAGHGARVLIADGNYPLATQSNPAGRRVYLNLTAGRLGVIEVLEVLAESIPIEAAQVMGPDDSSEPSIYADFRRAAAGNAAGAAGPVRVLRRGRSRAGHRTRHRHRRAAAVRQRAADDRRGAARADGPLVPSRNRPKPPASGDGRRAFRYRLALGPTRASRSISASGGPPRHAPAHHRLRHRRHRRRHRRLLGGRRLAKPAEARAARSRASTGASAPSPCRGR